MAQDQIHTYSSTQWVCTLGHSPYFVMFAYPDDWVFSDIRCTHWGIPLISFFVDVGCCGIKSMLF